MQAVTANRPFRRKANCGAVRHPSPLIGKERKIERNSGKLRNSGLSQFHRDAQIDLGHDLVEAIVARGVMEVGSHCFKPQHRGLVECAGEQTKLKLVKGVERPAAVFDRTAPAFDRIFDALERNERIDATQSTQGNGSAVRARGVRFAKRESLA